MSQLLQDAGMDPIFDQSAAFSEEEVGEWFNLMLEHNAKLMSHSEADVESYDVGERFTQQLFGMCDSLQITAEAKINAAIVLNKYLNTLKTKASNLLLNESNIHIRRQLHEQVRTRMLRHMPLRMISAIQIASKMHTYRYTPTLKEFLKYLETIDQPYLLEELVSSEMTVVEAIDFEVNNTYTPVAYLETVLQMFALGRENPENFNVQKYWKAALHVLELVFLSFDETMKYVIKSFIHINKNANRNLDRPSMKHLKCDYLLLSCGCLCVPVGRLGGKNSMKEMARQLSALTSLQVDHILASANGIVHMIRSTQKSVECNRLVASRLDRTMWSLMDEESSERRRGRKRPATTDLAQDVY